MLFACPVRKSVKNYSGQLDFGRSYGQKGLMCSLKS